MQRLVLIEWAIILLALLSLWPVILGYQSLPYTVYMGALAVALLWVTRNRLARTREAAKEAKEKHDEATKYIPPPHRP